MTVLAKEKAAGRENTKAIDVWCRRNVLAPERRPMAMNRHRHVPIELVRSRPYGAWCGTGVRAIFMRQY